MTTPAPPGAFDQGLGRMAANHVPLTPLSFLARSAAVHPDRVAIRHGALTVTYRDFAARCRRLASALARRGIGRGDCVAFMAPNVPAMVEAHFGVPMAGAVLNAINTRLDPATVRFILEHSGAKAFVVDRELAQPLREVLAGFGDALPVFEIEDDATADLPAIGAPSYESLLAEGDPAAAGVMPLDEWDAISLNYTSGTTGDPKGVVYHHRGAYLNALGNAQAWALPHHPVYLWTLPLFHCNGWCFPWTVTAYAGTHVCLRRVEAKAVLDAIRNEGITHFCGAPIVLNMLANAPAELKSGLPDGVRAMTAGAAPPAAVIGAVEAMGVEVTHVYGLTEVYGPVVVCERQADWDGLSKHDLAVRKARQGVPYAVQEGLDVLDPETGRPVPADGATMGEIVMRGNVVMKGYLKNPKATEAAFAGGWFHTGDLAVRHPDGYVEIRDRLKDIIISGGENISTIEVEGVLYRHPAVLEAAVVAEPHEKWGESPCAFVTLKAGAEADAAAIIAFCRDNMAGYKVPRRVVFGPLPKTSTGKIQKFVLRREAADLAAGGRTAHAQEPQK